MSGLSGNSVTLKAEDTDLLGFCFTLDGILGPHGNDSVDMWMFQKDRDHLVHCLVRVVDLKIILEDLFLLRVWVFCLLVCALCG